MVGEKIEEEGGTLTQREVVAVGRGGFSFYEVLHSPSPFPQEIFLFTARDTFFFINFRESPKILHAKIDC